MFIATVLNPPLTLQLTLTSKVVKTASGNWAAVFPKIDLETIPLEIKTDSTIGSGDQVWVRFYTSVGDLIGRVRFRFSSTPQYHIAPCTSSWTNFPVSLPTEVEKVWRITLNRNSGIRFLIHCNNVEVLNFLMSSDTCGDSSWSTHWNKTVGKMAFFGPNYNAASDYYRAGQTGETVMPTQHITLSNALAIFKGKLINWSMT